MLGEGGEGPGLKRPVLRYAADDEALMEVISEGIQGTGMPGTFGPQRNRAVAGRRLCPFARTAASRRNAWRPRTRS